MALERHRRLTRRAAGAGGAGPGTIGSMSDAADVESAGSDVVVTAPLGPDNEPMTYEVMCFTHLSLRSSFRRPNAYADTVPGAPGSFPHGIELEFGRDLRDPVELAKALVVAETTQAFHEALEWVTVDGRRVADPHPQGDDGAERYEMWDWLRAQLDDVLGRYRERYPAR